MRIINEIAVFGSHPDDIEIGCSGSCAKFIEQGIRVKWIILTSEKNEDQRNLRQKESLTASKVCGIPEGHVFFFEKTDGRLTCNHKTVRSLRDFLKKNSICPDLVIVHTDHDSHNDHVQANRLIKSTFRKKVILEYRVVNSGLYSHFKPEIFIDTSLHQNKKISMLNSHVSQVRLNRIMWDEIDEMDRRYSSHVKGDYCEAFSLLIQEGANTYPSIVSEINDDKSATLWNLILNNKKTTLILGRPVHRVDINYTNGRINHDWEAAQTIRNSIFTSIQLSTEEVQAGTYDDEFYFEKGNVILIGGSGSNNAVLRHFNHLPQLRYIITYDAPGYQNLCILDKTKNKFITADYSKNHQNQRIVIKDKGILSIMKNPYNENSMLCGIMGIHGSGTRTGAGILSCEESMFDIIEPLKELSEKKINGFQIIYECSPSGYEAKNLENYLHKW